MQAYRPWTQGRPWCDYEVTIQDEFLPAIRVCSRRSCSAATKSSCVDFGCDTLPPRPEAAAVGAESHNHPVAVGDLIRWRGKWITEPPTHCPNGHRLGPYQTLVGHTACGGHGGGGHTIWHCLACDAITYGPAVNTHCNIAIGPAAVRLSTAKGQREVPNWPPPPPPF